MRALLCSLVVFSAWPALAEPAKPAPTSVRFEGNHELTTATLEDVVYERGLDDVNELMEGVAAAYFDAGFIEINVDPVISAESVLVIKLREGPRYQLGNLRFTGRWARVPHDLRALMHIQPGDTFSRKRVHADLLMLEDLTKQSVTIETSVNRDARTVDLAFVPTAER